MKTYHFSWYTDKSILYSKGKDYEGESLYEALALFYEENPECEPFAIIDKSVRINMYQR